MDAKSKKTEHPKKRLKYIFLLSAEDLEMAKEEILSISDKPTKTETENNLLISELSIDYTRPAMMRKACKHLFSCKKEELKQKFKQIDWTKEYSKNFRVRIHNIKTPKNKEITEKELAKHIWKSIKEPKVNLNNPQTPIEIWLTEKKAHCGILLHENKEPFSSRRSHKRPFNMPTTLDPKLARACINLSGIQPGEVLMDPFCGAGGILLEAGLMNFPIIGYDIDSTVLNKCKKNLEHYKITDYKVELGDATKITNKADVIVTDLPYGQSSMLSSQREKLYTEFINHLNNIMNKKAVVIFPEGSNCIELLQEAGLIVEKKFTRYVHGSLTRKIVIVKKKN